MTQDIDYARFPGRPWRHVSQARGGFSTRWTGWRSHACASLLETMLAERGLHEFDVLIVESGPSLAVETADDVRFLESTDNPFDQAAERSALADELDHVVAWLLRDRMVAATLPPAGDPGPWFQEPAHGRHGIVARPWTTLDDDGAVPAWAVTASTPLLAHLASHGVIAPAALRAACAVGTADGLGRTWHALTGCSVTLEDGRLHCTSYGTGAYVVDRDGFDLILPGQTLPETVCVAARGRRLSEVISLSEPPPLLTGLDPLILDIAEHDDPWSGERPGLRVRLAAGTETLADIPPAALAAISADAHPVPRTMKPWLVPGLRADGTARSSAGAAPAEGWTQAAA